LSGGEQVSFNFESSPRGPRATGVRPADEAAEAAAE
jgi:cold shock CspA family protein